MICARCDLALLPGEPYTKHDVEGGSGAAPAVTVHLVCPQKPAFVRRYPVTGRADR